MSVEGAFAVRNNFGDWTVPAGHAAWIPARFRYALEPLPRAVVRTLYISVGRRSCGVVAPSPLVRAIVDHVCTTSRALADAECRHLLAVVIDQLQHHRELPLFVPALSAPLARRVADALAADPASMPRIRDLATELGVSERTLDRTFVTDAGMSLGEWRQRSRVCRAIALLAGGLAVKDVALEVGYETPSAFVAAFRKYVAATPGAICRSSASRSAPSARPSRSAPARA